MQKMTKTSLNRKKEKIKGNSLMINIINIFQKEHQRLCPVCNGKITETRIVLNNSFSDSYAKVYHLQQKS